MRLYQGDTWRKREQNKYEMTSRFIGDSVLSLVFHFPCSAVLIGAVFVSLMVSFSLQSDHSCLAWRLVLKWSICCCIYPFNNKKYIEKINQSQSVRINAVRPRQVVFFKILLLRVFSKSDRRLLSLLNSHSMHGLLIYCLQGFWLGSVFLTKTCCGCYLHCCCYSRLDSVLACSLPCNHLVL